MFNSGECVRVLKHLPGSGIKRGEIVKFLRTNKFTKELSYISKEGIIGVWCIRSEYLSPIEPVSPEQIEELL